MPFRCPTCKPPNNRAQCTDSREIAEGTARWRRYKCPNCGKNLYTIEEILPYEEKETENESDS